MLKINFYQMKMGNILIVIFNIMLKLFLIATRFQGVQGVPR
jgi:hypothetical protein